MPTRSPSRGLDDRDVREARMLKLAIGVGLVAFLLILAQLAVGGDTLVLALFAMAFLALSGGAFAALRWKVWRAWSPRKIPRRRAMGVFVLVGAGSIGFYIWVVLGGVAISTPLAWWESLVIVMVGTVFLAFACVAGYRNLVRQGVIV